MNRTSLFVAMLLLSTEADAQALLFFVPTGQLPLSGNANTIQGSAAKLHLQEIILKAQSIYGPMGAFPSGDVSAALRRDGVILPSDNISAARSGSALRLALQGMQPDQCNALLLGFPWDDPTFKAHRPQGACAEGRLSFDLSLR